MTKAAPHTPTVSVISPENADALIAEATGLRKPSFRPVDLAAPLLIMPADSAEEQSRLYRL